MNMAKLKRDFAAKMAASAVISVDYRGHVISGVKGRNWFVSESGRDWVTFYPSQAKARAAVDECWITRAMSSYCDLHGVTIEAGQFVQVAA